MSASKRRIEKLESERKLSDVISLWLDRLEQLDSPAEYLESALGDGENNSIEYQIIQHASARRKIARNGGRDKSIDAEISHSLKRVIFLKTLRWAANCGLENIVVDCRRRLESVLQIVEILYFFRDSDAWTRPYQRLNPPSTVSAANENFAPVPAAEDAYAPVGGGEFFVAKVSGIISEVLCDLHAAELALGSISARFFQGRIILFQSIARAMDEAHQAAGICAENLRKTEPDNRACSEQFEGAAEHNSEVLVRKLVDCAKAVALLRFDERAKAREILKGHLQSSCGTEGETDLRR